MTKSFLVSSLNNEKFFSIHSSDYFEYMIKNKFNDLINLNYYSHILLKILIINHENPNLLRTKQYFSMNKKISL